MTNESIKIIHTELNGVRIAYTSQTVFLVQVGRYSKGHYKTKYTIVGSLGQAVTYYNGINLGNGYKKRLICPEFNKQLLARQYS